MKNQFKQIIKKLYKDRLFTGLTVESNYIGFRNADGMLFTFQTQGNKNAGYFTAGYVRTWNEYKPTFESGYNSHGNVACAKYDLIFKQRTDNPDFIYRQAKAITLNLV